jgi:hypothetical protein
MSHEPISLFLHVYPCIVARQRLYRNFTAAKNTCDSRRIVGRFVFYAVRVVLKESTRLVLPRTFCYLNAFTLYLLHNSSSWYPSVSFPLHMPFLFLFSCSLSLSIYKYIFLSSITSHMGVGIATGYGLDDGGVGVRIQVGSRIFSSPRRPDRPWGPPSLLPNGYRGYPLGSGLGVKLITHLKLVPRSRKCGSIYPLPHTPSWRNA